MGPHPAVAQVRSSVRRCLAELAAGDLALAACSGGADSLALAAALAHEAPRQGIRGGGVTVDHGLQPGSAERACAVAQVLAGFGLDPVRTVTTAVAGYGEPGQGGPGHGEPWQGAPGQGAPGQGGPGQGGPEAAARAARYAALGETARQTGAVAVLLGHSLDDQAETVLLGLARGSGARSLAGMPVHRGCYHRPLLGLSRATLRAACAAQGLVPWDDPHNHDPAYARARVRHRALPALEESLGPGVAEALARTARQLRADADALDALAASELERARAADGGWRADLLAAMPAAIRYRVLRQASVAAGCPPGALTAHHVEALESLITDWRGQRWTDLPGGVRGSRQCGKLLFTHGRRAGPAVTAGPEGTEARVGRE